MAPAESREPAYKRPVDLAIFAVAHLLLLPMWTLIWGLIPLAIFLDDRGPVLYRQRRIGKSGRTFYALKFRTMVKDADKIGAVWTAEKDPRLTRVGRVLRHTALDELPQVINILRGEMSFVGPRALAEEEHRHWASQINGFERRLQVRPGLTGLAQIFGNRDLPRQKLRYDLLYIKRMGLGVDLKLLFLSLWITFRGRWEKRGKKL
ncbi:MAG: sugar transferase [Chloroflexi bacterium]|nr:sugar transferase [Chloroflexota bacterium]